MEGRFEEVWLRGDTDFSLTEHLDRWDKRCKFVLGFDARPNLVALSSRDCRKAVGGVEANEKYKVWRPGAATAGECEGKNCEGAGV